MFKFALWILVALFAGLAIIFGFWSYQAYQGEVALFSSSMKPPPTAVLFMFVTWMLMVWALVFASMARDPNYK